MNLSIVSLISLLSPGKFENKKAFGNTCLSTSGQEINHLLNGTSPVHIQRDIDQILCNRVTNDIALLVCRVLKKLLTQVVTKRILTNCQKNRGVTKITYQSSAPQSDQKSLGKSCHDVPLHLPQVSFANNDNHVGPCIVPEFLLEDPPNGCQQIG